MSSLVPRVKCGCIIKPKVARIIPFVKTPKNRVSSAKAVHIAESSFKGQNRKVHKMCAGYREIPDKKFRHGLGFGPTVNWFDPTPILSAMMLPLPTYTISNKNESPTMFSIGFVSVWFWTCLNDCTSIIFEEIPCDNFCTCFLMYLRNALLDHLPISMIEKIGTPERYMAIAAPKQMDLVPISDRRMPSFVSPIVTTPSRHKSAIISAVTLMIVFLCFTRETEEFLLVPLYGRILLVINAQIFTEHRSLSHVRH
jgi:hypothetical protein